MRDLIGVKYAGKDALAARQLGLTGFDAAEMTVLAGGGPKIPEASFLDFEKAGQVQCPEYGHVFGGAI